MYRGVNFTESNESYRNIEGEMQIAARLWAHFQDRGCRSREDRSRAAYEFACEIFESKIGKMPVSFTDLSTDQQAIWMMDGIVSDWYSEWAENAFPRVQMSHSYAAMLMATTISAKELDQVEAPWPAFAVEIPDKLLPIQAKGVESCITRVCVNTHFMPSMMPAERWWTHWMQGPRIELHRAGTLDDMATGKSSGKGHLHEVHDAPRLDALDAPLPEDHDAFWEHYDDDQENRIAMLVSRLVIGVCVMMTEKANYVERPIDLSKKIGPFASRFQKMPESRLYTLGKPTKVDFRQAVRAFVEGRSRGAMTVQRLVAGHYKRQPYGPNSSLRKWIFRQPYWQGPSDGPVLVRPHVISAEGILPATCEAEEPLVQRQSELANLYRRLRVEGDYPELRREIAEVEVQVDAEKKCFAEYLAGRAGVT